MKKRSRILDEMQETDEGLLQANIITQLQADEIVALCQTQITPLSSSGIQLIQESHHLT
jgi:DNA-binding transcriptional regulator YiaG